MKGMLAGVALAALFGGSAMAADLRVKAPMQPLPPPIWSWTGFYIGINGGYSFGTSDVTQVLTQPPAQTASSFDKTVVAPQGGIFGGQVGFNWQVGSIVFGAEFDAQWSDQDDRGCGFLCLVQGPQTLASTVDQKLRWFSTARGRVGWANDSYLIYFTAGGAWGSMDETDTLILTGAPGSPFTATFRNRLSGYAIGGGIEARLWGPLTGRLEYLHLDFGDHTNVLVIPTGGGNATLSTTSSVRDDIIRAALNYKFDFGGPGYGGPGYGRF